MSTSFRFTSSAARAALAGAALAAGAAHAADISTINLLTQGEFRQLSEDAAAAVSFKPMIPPASLGLTGFDVGLSATGTQLQHRDVWRKAAAGEDVPGTLPVVGLRAHKGLPFDIDVGVSYSLVPSTNVRATGGELRWAPLPGSALLPAVAVRLSASALSGVDQMKMHTTGIDVSISKGFTFLTPYVGLGQVNVRSSAPGALLIRDENYSLNKLFAGVNVSLGLMNLAFEADKTGDAPSYGAKLGMRF